MTMDANKRKQSNLDVFFTKKPKSTNVDSENTFSCTSGLQQTTPFSPRTSKVSDSNLEFSTNEDQSNDKSSNESSVLVSKPECWDLKQLKYFSEEYPWLFYNANKLGCIICKKTNLNLAKNEGHVAKEWVNGEVNAVGSDINKMQANIRKKICKHKSSHSHLNAQQIIDKSKMEVLPGHITKVSNLEHETTQKIFRSAYYIAKNQRPYTDLPKLVDLQSLNGIQMGRVLQSDKSCSNIIEHISLEMRKKISNNIIENQRKICVIVDESTTLSQKTMLVICLRTVVGENNEVVTFFFDIVELKNTSAVAINNAIINNLSSNGMDENFLKQNLIAFVSDGASSMLGRVAGVGVQLKKMYPNIVVWHCCNHRLELAVSDTLKEVSGTNNFQLFVEKLYALYHQSPKNMNELNICAASLESNLLRIGKIFSIRWVASSEKTIKAVWNNFPALYKHFSSASTDDTRTLKEKSKYFGLKNTLASVEFVKNLGIMYDALSELADLSSSLQNRNHTLTQANDSIRRIVGVFNSMSTNYGPKTEEAIRSCEQLFFYGVPLICNKAIPKINASQFFTSLANNLSSRLFTTQASNVSVKDYQFKNQYTQLLNDLDILDQNNWPDNYDIQFGDSAIRRLVKTFQVDEKSTIRGFREFKDTRNKLNILDLNPLLTAIKTIAISSSECERAFSSMNNLVTTKRNALSSTHISSLMFINCVGPPVQTFKPHSYVLSWIHRGKRSAEEECCPKRKNTDVNHSYEQLWSVI